MESTFSQDGEKAGILGITVTLDYTQKVIAEIQPYGNGRAALYAANGIIVAHPLAERIGTHYQEVVGLSRSEITRIEQAFKDGKPVTLNEKINIVQYFPGGDGNCDHDRHYLRCLPL
jgi:hypothetical protein